MKTIICGGRTVTNLDILYLATAGLKITEVVSGGAHGADNLGEQFAEIEGLPLKVFPAEWYKYGKSAGPKRNEQMGDYADRAVALWDGKSRGTKHMISYMKKLGKPVFVLDPTRNAIKGWRF